MIMSSTTEQVKGLNFLLFFGILVFGILLLLSVNTFYWADDYGFMLNLNSKGVVNNCIYGYYNWDGRFLTIGALVQGFFLKYIAIEYITLFWSLCFLGSGLFIYCILDYEIGFKKITTKHYILYSILMSIVLWLGSLTHFNETIYWGTGGVYSFNLLLGTLWIVWFLQMQKNDYHFIIKVLFILFSIITGSSTQNLSIGLITLLIITVIIDYFNNRKTNLKYNAILFTALTIGLLIIILAPGNFKRMQNIDGIGVSNITILSLLKGFASVLFNYGKRATLLTMLSLMGAFAIYFNQIDLKKIEFSTKLKNTTLKEKLVLKLVQCKWLIVALSTTTPFIFMPEMASYRTTIYFLFFIQIFIFHFILTTNFKFSDSVIIKPKLLSFLLISLIILGAGIFSTYNFSKGLVLKTAIVTREKYLKNSKGKTVTIQLINPKLKSKCYNFSDFKITENNQEHFINDSQEKYFGVKKILVVK